tara:strand:- start:45 stop:608 length:564 start_codon:yes stop_codon:yes gene_type:complete
MKTTVEQPTPHYVFGIDPAFGGTGIALFQDKVLTNVLFLKRTGKKRFENRAHSLSLDVAEWIRVQVTNPDNPSVEEVGPPLVMCEIPAYQSSPSRSMGWKKGDLQKLTYLVGSMGYACSSTILSSGDNPYIIPYYATVTPAGWKGQLSKEIVIQRIKKRIPNVVEQFNPYKDIWDAIGIGMWTIGNF